VSEDVEALVDAPDGYVWGIGFTINLKRQRMNAIYCAVPWGCVLEPATSGRNVFGAV
jgi:hypothetical protein